MHDRNWPDKTGLERLTAQAVEATASRLGIEDAASELSLVFTNDAEIRRLNAEWRQRDKATNVLSFPVFPLKVGNRPGPMLGDIILARETVEREAEGQAKTLSNHVSHLIVHGLLHLLGYDHENNRDAEIMERLEQEIVHTLAIPDPYAVLLVD